MKKIKIIFILIALLLIFSCSKNKDWKNIVEDTSDIIWWYSDTLEWSIKDARDVTKQYEEKNKKLEKDLNSVR